MRKLVTILLLSLACGAALATQTVRVDDDCSGPGTGSDSQPYCTIQQAICQLRDTGGGTVLVEPGLYNESLRMFPGVSVVSTGGPERTTIDATGRLCTTAQCEVIDPDVTRRCAAVVWGGGSPNSDRLEGFRITGGSGLPRLFNDGSDAQTGGGVFVFNSSPTITNNVIADNALFSKTSHNFWGGGIYLGGGSYSNPTYPVITHNVIEGNASTPTPGDVSDVVPGSEAVGAGIYVGLFTAPTIEGNVIRDNVAGDAFTELGVGGGIAVYSISPARRPQISRNVIRGNASTDLGGGVFFGQVFDGYTPVPTRGLVANNVIEENVSHSGGGVLTHTTTVELLNNTLVYNVAQLGGGVALYGSSSFEPTLVNNVVAYNAANIDGGGGVAFFTTPDVVDNNDLFGNAPDQVGGNKSDADYIGVDGNVSLAPLFSSRAPGVRDLTPLPGSPLIDRGIAVAGPAVDLVGAPRVLDGDADGVPVVDLGAIEFAPDGDADGVPDYQDNCTAVANGGQADADADGKGDDCDPCAADPNDDGDNDGVCGDLDLCPDMADPQQPDQDGDGDGDACDPDDDNDGIDDASDPAPLDRFLCGDFDGDSCDDCTSGARDAANDGDDLDADGLCDAADADDDGDGVDDTADCADHAPGVTTSPGSVGNSLLFDGDHSLGWRRAAQATIHSVYRGQFAPGADFTWNMTCSVADVTTTHAPDDTSPAPGSAYFYIVAGRNVCGDGPLRDSGDPAPFAANVCALSDRDRDDDGIADLADNCPDRPGADPQDTDNDGRGDRCDACPWGERADGACLWRPATGERDDGIPDGSSGEDATVIGLTNRP